MHVCTFTITEYGTSGTELPPPPVRQHIQSILSGEKETEAAFKARMQDEGMAIRNYLAFRFKINPDPYSCASSCSWSISPIGGIAELIKQLSTIP